MSLTNWKSIEDWFDSFWQGKQSYCFQFHDTRAAMGAAKSSRVFTTAHPSDFLVTHLGEMFYAEVKKSEDKTSFPLKNIRPAQWKAAVRQTAAGGKYFFFLYSTAMNCWYRIEGPVFISFWKSGRASVKWAELLDYQWNPPTPTV